MAVSVAPQPRRFWTLEGDCISHWGRRGASSTCTRKRIRPFSTVTSKPVTFFSMSATTPRWRILGFPNLRPFQT